MAPEIFKGVYGNEIDIYAFGLILYEMVCKNKMYMYKLKFNDNV